MLRSATDSIADRSGGPLTSFSGNSDKGQRDGGSGIAEMNPRGARWVTDTSKVGSQPTPETTEAFEPWILHRPACASLATLCCMKSYSLHQRPQPTVENLDVDLGRGHGRAGFG